MKKDNLLTRLSNIAAIIGIPIAIFTLIFSSFEAQKSRDLEISLSLIETFRSEWEEDWRGQLRELKAIHEKIEKPKIDSDAHLDNIRDMLNWVDWLGLLMKHKMLKNSKVILDGIRPQLIDILTISEFHIKKGLSEKGCDWWGGIVYINSEINAFDYSGMLKHCNKKS